ncbi:MAG: formyl transferase [Verrucomicrobia bacterium]|nr:formyl transferase [Verrucomicrobiota bacterium]
MNTRSYLTIGLVGPDRTGAIAAVTQHLFRIGANIESLEEQVARGKFRMTLLASWPSQNLHEPAIRRGLEQVARNLRMRLTLRIAEGGRARRKLALLVSRETHVLDAILREWKRGGLRADPVLVAGNHPQLGGIARRYGLPFRAIDYRDRVRAESALQEHLEKSGAELIVLARFMKILSPDFVWHWKNRILNIHPSLLPAFPGASAYRQAYDKGVPPARRRAPGQHHCPRTKARIRLPAPRTQVVPQPTTGRSLGASARRITDGWKAVLPSPS